MYVFSGSLWPRLFGAGPLKLEFGLSGPKFRLLFKAKVMRHVIFETMVRLFGWHSMPVILFHPYVR